jgi:hypothetical protein
LSKHPVRVDREAQSFVHLVGDGRVNQNHQPVPPKQLLGGGDKNGDNRAAGRVFSGDVRRLPDGQDENGQAKFVDAWTGGIVYAPDKDWADEVISEVADFPYGEHDDWTDTVSQALGWVRRNGVVLRKAEWDEQEYERAKFRRPAGVPYAIGRS